MRRSKRFIITTLLGAVVCLVAGVGLGQAALIEFTGAPYNTWYPGPSLYSSVVDDIAFQVSAYSSTWHGLTPANLGYKYEARDGAVAEGIGVYGGYAGGEIDPGQELRVELSDATAQNNPVYLSSFTVNFLYWEYTNQAPWTQYFEGLSYSIDSGVTWNTLYQPDIAQTYPNPFTPGELIVSFGANTLVSDLRLRSSGQTDHDYTLNSIVASTNSAVPEPSTALLLVSALGIVGVVRRRAKRKSVL